VLWRRNGTDLRALSLGPSVVSGWIQAALTDDDQEARSVNLVVPGADGEAGPPPEPGRRTTRSPSETRLPWTLVVTSGDSPALAADLNSRRQLLTSGLMALALFLTGGSYLLWRVVQRELAVARLQTDFVAAVSHEFRTPLTSLRHITELLQESDDLSPARRQSFYELLGSSTERLHRLVESLLDFSHIEHGGKRWELRELDARDLVARVVADFRKEHPGLTLALQMEWPDVEMVHGDPGALGNALWNLLDNAVKYSPDRGTICVSVGRVSGGVALAVRDHGLGIPADERKAVFAKFVRGRKALGLGIRGTGLGLAMVS